MSVANRNVGMYELMVTKNEKNDKTPFIDFNRVRELFLNSPEKFIFNNVNESKWYSIENIIFRDDIFYITFSNCKYNHAPNYIDTNDGSERNTAKQLYEGEKEITHAILKNNVLYLEKRRSGTGNYVFNKMLNNVINDLNQNFTDSYKRITFHAIMRNDFLEIINKSKRIKNIRLEVSNIPEGTPFYMFENDENIKNEYIVSLKAKKSKSIDKETTMGWLERNLREGKNHKITIEVNDENNNNLIINSDSFSKIHILNVELLEDGTVNSNDIFNKLKYLLEIEENV